MCVDAHTYRSFKFNFIRIAYTSAYVPFKYTQKTVRFKRDNLHLFTFHNFFVLLSSVLVLGPKYNTNLVENMLNYIMGTSHCSTMMVINITYGSSFRM